MSMRFFESIETVLIQLTALIILILTLSNIIVKKWRSFRRNFSHKR
jgi:hypothetical protein